MQKKLQFKTTAWREWQVQVRCRVNGSEDLTSTVGTVVNQNVLYSGLLHKRDDSCFLHKRGKWVSTGDDVDFF